jgi:hypothetical protein
VNGQVGLLHTAFQVQGTPEEVVDFFAGLCTWLGDPSLHHLEHEARVLRAEEAQRPPAPLPRHLMWRYGAQGPGLAAYDELGLHTATEPALRHLAARSFVRGNAVLAMAGALPAGLRIPLPDGPRVAVPLAVPCDQPYPAEFADRVAGVAVSGVVERSVAAVAYSRLLQRAVHRRFRSQDGVGYAAWSAYEPVDRDHAVVAAGIDVLPEARSGSADRMADVVSELAAGSVDAAAVADDAHRMLEEMRARPTALWAPFAIARDELLGSETLQPVQLFDRSRAVTARDITEVGIEVRETFLVGVDGGTPQSNWLPRLQAPPLLEYVEHLPRGRTFRLVDHPVDRSTLTVSEEHVAMGTAGRSFGARRGEVAAMLAFPDGGRTVIRPDGYQVSVEPTLWRHGDEAVRLLDELIGRDLRIEMPERDAKAIPRPTTSRWARIRARVTAGAATWRIALLAIIALCACAAVVTAVVRAANGHSDAVFTAVLPLIVLVRIAVALLRVDRRQR